MTREMNEIETMFFEAFCRICPSQVSELEPQAVIGIYKADFKIRYYVIEIDGHEFHKTKEQREYDYARERYFQKHGYFVVRFMGTEIFLDADKCVRDLVEITEAYLSLMKKRFSEIPQEMVVKKKSRKRVNST